MSQYVVIIAQRWSPERWIQNLHESTISGGFMSCHWAKVQGKQCICNHNHRWIRRAYLWFVLSGGKRQCVAPASPAWTAIPRKPSRLTFGTGTSWIRQMVAVAVSVGKRWSVAGQEHGFDDRQFSPFGKARLKQTQICDLISVLFNQPVPHHWMVHQPAADLRFTHGWFHMIGRMFLYCWYTSEWSFWWPKTIKNSCPHRPIGPIDTTNIKLGLVTLRHSALEWCDVLIAAKKEWLVPATPETSTDHPSDAPRWSSPGCLLHLEQHSWLALCLEDGKGVDLNYLKYRSDMTLIY